MSTGWYTDEELLNIGFANIGKNFLLSKKGSIYGASNITIGDNVRIDDFVSISSSGLIKIGSNVHIGSFSYMAGLESIILEGCVGIAQGVRIYSTVDDFYGFGLVGPMVDDKYRKVKSAPVQIKKYSAIGEKYTEIIEGIILYNSLTDFDKANLLPTKSKTGISL